MATVLPFAALRPPRDKVQLVATRSYVSYGDTALRDKLDNNPFTFLHVIHPDPPEGPVTHGIERYTQVKNAFDRFVDQGIFVPDPAPAYYLYRQVKDGFGHTGLVAAVSLQDYAEGRIKVHEHTLTAREEMFRDYLDHTGFNAEPVLLSHPHIEALEAVYDEVTQARPEYEFTSTDRVLHLFWPVVETRHIDAIRGHFARCEALYIADGHHRTASSALLSAQRPESRAAAHFMGLLLSERQLRVASFARLVRHSYRDLPGVLTRLSAFFEIEPMPHFEEPQRHTFVLYGESRFHRLRFKPGVDLGSGVEALDPSLVSRFVLDPILGAHDARTDQRLAFLPDLDSGRGMVQAVDSGAWEFGIALAPLNMGDVRMVSDAGQILPPKSTYIEPKLRSGMVIYRLDDEHFLG